MSPLKLYYRGGSPNPWKVAIIIEALHLPYQLIRVENVKSPEFLNLNPNGRVPALEDPNYGCTTWESGSIIDYLIDTYDAEHKLSYTTTLEKAATRNWAHFQMSGQGPYFGQKAWFSNYHPEKVQSAVDRYAGEIKRVLGVIESHLGSTGHPCLVGGKPTYADFMWVPWNELLGFLLGPEFNFEAEFPKTFAWHQSLLATDGVTKMLAARAKALNG